jgi:hypothetical protein
MSETMRTALAVLVGLMWTIGGLVPRTHAGDFDYSDPEIQGREMVVARKQRVAAGHTLACDLPADTVAVPAGDGRSRVAGQRRHRADQAFDSSRPSTSAVSEPNWNPHSISTSIRFQVPTVGPISRMSQQPCEQLAAGFRGCLRVIVVFLVQIWIASRVAEGSHQPP